MKKIYALCLLSFLLFSCQQEGRIYAEHLELSPDVEWLSEDKREFNIPIEDNSIPYNMSLSFRYATGYQYQVAKLKVTETSPSGKVTTEEYDLKIRDDNGDYIGDPGFDIWDSEHIVVSNKTYKETGIYTYLIEHVMPSDPLYYAMSVGVILDKVNKTK